jgi:hypothetical protein
MKRNLIFSLIVMCFVGAVFSGCKSTEKVPEEQIMMKSTDLDYSGFFLTGKTDYVIEGKMVSSSLKFTNYLEGSDYEAFPNGEDVVLKGAAGELWRSSFAKVQKTYTKLDGSELGLDDFIIDSFIKLKTKPSGMTYFALHLSLNYLVEVQTAWGDVLQANRPEVPHGNGDYLICRKGADGNPDLSDTWIVNGVVFPYTYDMTNSK